MEILHRSGSLSKVTSVAILTSIIDLTPILCFCACSVVVYIKDLTNIWQISGWKQTVYCTQKRLKSWTKNIFIHVSNKDPESTYCFCDLHSSLICTCMRFCSHTCSFLHHIFRRYFHVFPLFFASSTLHNVLKLNQPIRWIVTQDLLSQKWNEKASLIGWKGFSGQ